MPLPPRQRLRGAMVRQALVLVLCLSLAVAASADCVTQCSLCAAQTHGTETSIRPLVSHSITGAAAWGGGAGNPG